MKAKLKFIIPSIIAVIAIIVAVLCIDFTPQEKTDVSSLMSTAQKYLIENQYEQAIAEFNKVIEIEPMNVDAYLGLAEAYVGMGDTDKAIEVLEKGYEITGDDRLKEMLDRLLLPVPEETTVTTTAATKEITTSIVESSTNKTDTITNFSETTINLGIDMSSNDYENVENSFDAVEKIKSDAIAIMDMFNVYKSNGEPNSIIYYYQKNVSNAVESGWYTGYVSKCIYNENGNLLQSICNLYYNDTQSVSTELEVNDWVNNRSVIYNHQSDVYYKCVQNYNNCYGDVDGGGMCYLLLYKNFEYLEQKENCYIFNSPFDDKIYIYLSESMKIEKILIENEYSNIEYKNVNGNWQCNRISNNSDYVVTHYPCEQELPKGCLESDFEIPLNPDDYKTFTSWEKYRDYGLTL